MSWHRVVIPVGFAACVTVVGFRVPIGVNDILLLPGALADRLLVVLGASSATSWFAAWLAIYAQLLGWVLFWETIRVLWFQWRAWDAKRAVRAGDLELMAGIILAGVLLPAILVTVARAGNRYLPRLARYGSLIILGMGVVELAGAVISLFQGPRGRPDWLGGVWAIVLGSCFIWLSRRTRESRNGPVAEGTAGR